MLPLVKTVIGIEFANLNDALFMRKLITSLTFSGDTKQLVKEERKRHGIVSYRLSRPTIFVRKQHNGWNPLTQTFNIKDCPKELRDMLKKAGFKKKHLKKKETAVEIYQYLLTQTNIDVDMFTQADENNKNGNPTDKQQSFQELNSSRNTNPMSGGTFTGKNAEGSLKRRQTIGPAAALAQASEISAPGSLRPRAPVPPVRQAPRPRGPPQAPPANARRPAPRPRAGGGVSGAPRNPGGAK